MGVMAAAGGGLGQRTEEVIGTETHIPTSLSCALSLSPALLLLGSPSSAAALRRCCCAAGVAAAARRQRTVDNILRHSSATPRIERFAAAGYDAWRVVSLLLIICCCCLYSVPFSFPIARVCAPCVCVCVCVCLCVLPPKSPKTPDHPHSAGKKAHKKQIYSKGKTTKRECVPVC